MQSTALLVSETLPRSSPEVFRQVVATYQRPLYGLAYDLTGNHHDAEDLSQEVFIKAYQRIDAFRDEAQLFSWLYRIAVNTYLNKRRKKALWFRQLWDDFTQTPIPLEEEGPDDNLETNLRRKHLAKALERLSPQERVAFTLRHFQGLSLVEVADTMNVAEGTVKSLLFRAVKKLRVALAFYHEDLGLSLDKSSR